MSVFRNSGMKNLKQKNNPYEGLKFQVQYSGRLFGSNTKKIKSITLLHFVNDFYKYLPAGVNHGNTKH